jgi:uncharacterized protein with GYD domain
MPFYLLQASYKDNQLKAALEAGSDRTPVMRALVESFGGKLHQTFLAFGEWDVVGILEFPDNESAAAALLHVESAGVWSRAQTTVLITTEEGMRAVQKVKATQTTYRPPLG